MAYEGEGSQEFSNLHEEQERLQWKKSDVLAVVLSSYGPKAVREIGRDHHLTGSYLVALAKVAVGVVENERYPTLSFSHHKLVWETFGERGDWKKWLRLADENSWSLSQLKSAIAAEEGGEISPSDAVRKASHARTALKRAGDETRDKPNAFTQVLDMAKEAFDYVKNLSKRDS